MRWMIISVGFALSGCAAFQNVSPADLRAEKHHVADGTIPMTIKQIQQAVFDYSDKCEDIGRLDVNPSDNTRATFTTRTPPTNSAILLIDLQQKGSVTEYQGYMYYSTWAHHFEHDIKVMSGAATCN